VELQFNLLSKDSLYYFYSNYGSNWIQVIKQTIIHNVIELSANYDLIEFFEKREEFKNELGYEISKTLKINTQNKINLKSIKLIDIKFSENLLNAIEQKLIEKQNTRATQIEGQINFINKQTEGMIRYAEKDILTINQSQLSNYENTKINLHNQCLENILKADANEYGAINDELRLNADNNLLNFIYAIESKKFKGTKIVNFPSYTIRKK